jgi:fluoroacetyl-CoA thioesterase
VAGEAAYDDETPDVTMALPNAYFVQLGLPPLVVPSSLIRRAAVCGPACTVAWQGRRGDPSPYADFGQDSLSMAKAMPIGARGEVEQTVELKHTLAAHSPNLPPVYSTPDMIRLMEIAAFKALQPYCEDDEITVGTAINIEHRAASGIGAKIRAEGVLESFDGRFYTVKVTARDDTQEIGRGTVGWAVVSVGRFLEKMKKGSR